MRILIAAQNYDVDNNGQAVFTRHLTEGLAARGHAVSVLTPSTSGPPAVRQGGRVSVHFVRSWSLAPLYPGVNVTFGAAADVERVVERHDPTVVHVQDHFPLCSAVVRVARQRGIALVATNHFMPENIIPFVPLLSRFAAIRTALRGLLWRQVVALFSNADVVTAPTKTAAAILERAGLPGRVRAISCGLDLAHFSPRDVDVSSFRLAHGIAREAIALLFVGRVDREKRLDVMLDALHRLGRSDLQLVVAGKGRDEEALRRQADALGVPAVFLGFVSAEDLPRLLRSVDLFVMPSEAELQSIATLEAMASERPVLASDAGALPELVLEGVNGYRFHSGEAADATMALQRLLQARLRWRDMGRESLRMARAHDLVATVDAYEAVYRTARAIREVTARAS